MLWILIGWSYFEEEEITVGMCVCGWGPRPGVRSRGPITPKTITALFIEKSEMYRNIARDVLTLGTKVI